MPEQFSPDLSNTESTRTLSSSAAKEATAAAGPGPVGPSDIRPASEKQPAEARQFESPDLSSADDPISVKQEEKYEPSVAATQEEHAEQNQQEQRQPVSLFRRLFIRMLETCRQWTARFLGCISSLVAELTVIIFIVLSVDEGVPLEITVTVAFMLFVVVGITLYSDIKRCMIMRDSFVLLRSYYS